MFFQSPYSVHFFFFCLLLLGHFNVHALMKFINSHIYINIYLFLMVSVPPIKTLHGTAVLKRGLPLVQLVSRTSTGRRLSFLVRFPACYSCSLAPGSKLLSTSPSLCFPMLISTCSLRDINQLNQYFNLYITQIVYTASKIGHHAD